MADVKTEGVKTALFNVRVSLQELEGWRVAAAGEGVSVSEWVRRRCAEQSRVSIIESGVWAGTPVVDEQAAAVSADIRDDEFRSMTSPVSEVLARRFGS